MAATTPQQVITNALTLLPGVLWPGAVPSAVMSADALIKLNDMIDSWSTERLLVYGIAANAYALVSGTNAYTIGVGGTLAASVRPLSIVSANIVTPSLNLRFALKLITTDEWNGVRDRAATATLPTLLYNDGLYPLSTLSLWPTPNSNSTELELYTWQQIANFANLGVTFDLPPGYERAITYNLCLDLAAEYRASVTSEVLKVAMESKAALKALNAPPTHIAGLAEEAMAKAQLAEAAQQG